MTVMNLDSKLIKPNPNPYTLESLIEGLDERGLLVLQVLMGQQAMKLLSVLHTKEVTKPSVIKPNAQDSGPIGLPTTS